MKPDEVNKYGHVLLLMTHRDTATSSFSLLPLPLNRQIISDNRLSKLGKQFPVKWIRSKSLENQPGQNRRTCWRVTVLHSRLKYLLILSQRGKSEAHALPFLPTSLRVQGQSPHGSQGNGVLTGTCIPFSQLTATPYIYFWDWKPLASPTLTHAPWRILTSSTLYVCLQLYIQNFPHKHSCLSGSGFFYDFTKDFPRIYTWYSFLLYF